MTQYFRLSYSQKDHLKDDVIGMGDGFEIYRLSDLKSPCELVNADPNRYMPWRTYFLFRRAMLRRLRFVPKNNSTRSNQELSDKL